MATRSEKQKKDTLNRFYNDFYIKELCFRHQEGHEIKAAVSEMVERIVNQIGYFDQRVQVNEILLVGSAAEETKIILPNEFDFQLVLQRFSQPGSIRLVKDCSNDDRHVHVVVEDNDLLTQHRDLLKDKHLICGHQGSLFTNSIYGLRDICLNAVKKAVRLVYFNENNNLIYNNKPIENALGTLTLYHYSCDENGPAFNLKCKWRRKCDHEDMDISIDLCFVMCICKPLSEMIRSEDLECQTYYKFAQKCGSVMVMPCKKSDSCHGGECFRIIFTEAELLLCKKLSDHHKKCYKILKYLLNGIPNMSKPYGIVSKWLDIVLNEMSRKVSIRANKIISCLSMNGENPTPFHSYALKLIVINHHYKMQCEERHCVVNCIDRMLNDILDILNPGICSWSIGKLPKLFSENELEISQPNQFLDERIILLKKQLEVISHAVYSSETFKLESVNCIWTQRAEIIMLLMLLFLFTVGCTWTEVALLRDFCVHTYLIELLLFVVESNAFDILPTGKFFQTIRRWWFRTRNHCWQLRTFVINIFVLSIVYYYYDSTPTFTDVLVMSFLFICVRALLLWEVRRRLYDITAPISFQRPDCTYIVTFFGLLLCLLLCLEVLPEWIWWLPK